MKRLIRKLVNWAYGYDISLEILITRQRLENFKTSLLDILIREGYKGAENYRQAMDNNKWNDKERLTGEK